MPQRDEVENMDDIWASFTEALRFKDDDQPNQPEQQHSGSLDTSECACTNTCNRTVDRTVDGFLICSGCGTAKDIQIDTGAEWRSFPSASGGGFDAKGKSSVIRCGEPASLLMPGTQLNTYIGKGGSARQQRIHQWYNVSAKERSLYQIFAEYQQIAATYGISTNTAMCATELYRQLQNEQESRNAGVKRCNVRQGLKAACLFYACKKMRNPRERKDIADMFESTTKIVTRGCNTFLDVMGDEFVKMEPLRAQDFLARFCRLLGISYPDELEITKIVQAASALDVLADSTPTSIASGCIYFYCVEHDRGITKLAIRDKCGSSQAIVSKIFNKLCLYRKMIIPNCPEVNEHVDVDV